MKEGILKHTNKGWFIESSDKDYKLHPKEESVCNDYADYSIDWIGKKVTFNIVKKGKVFYAITEKFIK